MRLTAFVEVLDMAGKAKFGKSGEWLRRQRVQMGLSLRDLGKRCGVSHMAISLWEHGKHQPTEHCVRGLAKGLGMPVDEVRRRMVP